ncbi:MAG: type VI secretion system baseplate subunit TssG [Myxococcales bacterium]|nr:type VI secretion system baseplate subunit TssG [Myxococcales bacterium]
MPQPPRPPKDIVKGPRSAQAGIAAPVPESVFDRKRRIISERAVRFSLGALLDALHELGYQSDQIEFRSHATQTHQAAVVSKVEWSETPQRRVIVTLNLGLLSSQSLLPSYFRAALDAQHEGTLTDFLNFFAHRLLRGSVEAQFPERDPSLFADFTQTVGQLRSLLGIRSLSTVHFVFSQLYPELEVSIARTTLQRPVRTRGIQVGTWSIGSGAVLGAVAFVPVSAIAIKLLSDDAVTGNGTPWAKEASERLLKQVFPLLARHGVYLEVSLILRDQRSFMVLRPNQFLGYVPLYSGPSPSMQPRSARTIILWSGEVPT